MSSASTSCSALAAAVVATMRVVRSSVGTRAARRSMLIARASSSVRVMMRTA
jgi:hypothetical protein